MPVNVRVLLLCFFAAGCRFDTAGEGTTGFIAPPVGNSELSEFSMRLVWAPPGQDEIVTQTNNVGLTGWTQGQGIALSDEALPVRWLRYSAWDKTEWIAAGHTDGLVQTWINDAGEWVAGPVRQMETTTRAFDVEVSTSGEEWLAYGCSAGLCIENLRDGEVVVFETETLDWLEMDSEEATGNVYVIASSGGSLIGRGLVDGEWQSYSNGDEVSGVNGSFDVPPFGMHSGLSSTLVTVGNGETGQFVWGRLGTTTDVTPPTIDGLGLLTPSTFSIAGLDPFTIVAADLEGTERVGGAILATEPEGVESFGQIEEPDTVVGFHGVAAGGLTTPLAFYDKLPSENGGMFARAYSFGQWTEGPVRVTGTQGIQGVHLETLQGGEQETEWILVIDKAGDLFSGVIPQDQIFDGEELNTNMIESFENLQQGVFTVSGHEPFAFGQLVATQRVNL